MIGYPRGVLRLLLLLGLAGCPKVDLDAGEQYLMVDELLARDPSSLEGKALRVHGFVKAGSVTQRVIDQEMVRSFIVHQKGKELRVVFQGAVPDTFRDQAEVVIKGRLVKSSPIAAKLNVTDGLILEGTELNAKCPTNYDRNAGPQPAKYE